jgi:16S rRNA (adenine1518-N6/adenine1519-N6)-dimethyltransferase
MPDLSTTLRNFLSRHGVWLNTNLGQHFLIDETVLEKIMEAADIQSTDHVVEIGPGIGVLTKLLVEHAKTVTAIELDRGLIALLTEWTGDPKNLEVINDNALSVAFPTTPYKIVANIPYHITSPLLRHAFLESSVTPTTLTLLIQREVAEKICDAEDAGMLTILVALFGTPRIVTKVPPGSFLPPPKVDSAVLHIECFTKSRTTPDVIEEIFRLTKLGFSQKRKMLRNTLGAFPEGMERLEALGIDPTRRPQTLTIDEWIALAERNLKNR